MGVRFPLPALILKKETRGMNKESKLVIIKDRYNKLNRSPKNIKSSGVVRKLARQIRNMEK